ncbi:hypothetical protein [Paenibacillus dokdonensis]
MELILNVAKKDDRIRAVAMNLITYQSKCPRGSISGF